MPPMEIGTHQSAIYVNFKWIGITRSGVGKELYISSGLLPDGQTVRPWVVYKIGAAKVE